MSILADELRKPEYQSMSDAKNPRLRCPVSHANIEG
jgi:hypothetical protein